MTGDGIRDTIILCQELQRALQLASMQHPCQRSTPIAISPEVDVRFPAYADSLARIQAIKAVSSWQGKITVITDRYWEACQQLQIAVKTYYDTFCKEAQSLEQLGGVTDMELQQAVARELSKRYAESERKLAEVILQRFAQNAKIRRPEETIAESPQVSRLIVQRLYDNVLYV